jgi:hypothetical protein
VLTRDVQDLARIGARVNEVGSIEGDQELCRGTNELRDRDCWSSHGGRARTMIEALGAIVAGRTVIGASVPLALFFAAHALHVTGDAGRLQKSESQEECARNAHIRSVAHAGGERCSSEDVQVAAQ